MSEQSDGVVTQLHKQVRAFLDDMHTYQQQLRETERHIIEMEREAHALETPRVETALHDAAARIRASNRALDDAEHNITPLLAENPGPRWE